MLLLNIYVNLNCSLNMRFKLQLSTIFLLSLLFSKTPKYTLQSIYNYIILISQYVCASTKAESWLYRCKSDGGAFSLSQYTREQIGSLWISGVYIVNIIYYFVYCKWFLWSCYLGMFIFYFIFYFSFYFK